MGAGLRVLELPEKRQRVHAESQPQTLREHLIARFTYDSDTGEFFRRSNPAKPAGCVQSTRYLAVRLNSQLCLLHRMAWLYYYGVEAIEHIDHIDGNGFNNAIANLRLAKPFENGQNRGINSNNTSGFPGVSFCKIMKKWTAEIMLHRVKHKLGYFESAIAADKARKLAKLELHKFSGKTRD